MRPLVAPLLALVLLAPAALAAAPAPAGVAAPAGAQQPPASAAAADDWAELGRTVAGELGARRFADVEARFDTAMAQALPAGKLATIWDALLAQTGPLGTLEEARVEEKAGHHVVVVTCAFAKARLDARLVFDAQRRLAGLFFAPSQPAISWSAPAYADPARFHERDVVVGSDPWRLPGTLTLPGGTGPFPAVVLVHGSGPQDADETTGANKPFKDLAWGLASRGVAVLRYTKRTAEHRDQLRLDESFTVEQETVADARAALALAAAQPEVDARRVFLLGHSLGGMLAPRIARGTEAAGLVLLAASARPLEVVLLDQVRYLASREPQSAETAAAVREVEEAARTITSPELRPAARVKLLGAEIPGSYFLDLRGYDPPAVAAALGKPVLVLQGERDYQVTRRDFDFWQAALAGGGLATFRLYPGLYHLFMPSTTPGTGLGSPGDYETAGHVAEAVVADIAAWIDAVRPRQPAPAAPDVPLRPR